MTTLFEKIQSLIPVEHQKNMDEYIKKNLSMDKYIDLIQKIQPLCEEHCNGLALPKELSSTLLAIKQEKNRFESAKASKFYETIVHMLQTEMTKRFVVERLKGTEEKKIDKTTKEGTYICLDSEHSQMYAFSDANKEVNYITEADEFSLEPYIKTLPSRKAVIKEINEFKEETPFAKIFKIPFTPEQLKKAAQNVLSIPEVLPPELRVKENPTGKIGWGYGLFGHTIPSQRNCHAFVYGTLLHMELLTKENVEEIAKNEILNRMRNSGLG